MKKIIASLLLLFFVIFPKTQVFADTATPPSVMVSPTPVAMVDYQLPYPGILPDNPLYVLKTLRDTIVIFFISDPLKKSAFYLLQSDKRLAASWYLLKKSPAGESLAFSTLSKSTNYMDMAVAQAKMAKASGEDTNTLQGELTDASAKHMSVVSSMATLSGITQKASITEEMGRLTDVAKAVSEISQK